MKKTMQKLLAGACAAGVLFAAVGVAGADDISNNLDASVDAGAETMTLTAGGLTGTTQLVVSPMNGDGKNGCNLTGTKTLVVSVASSNTAVATVSPPSVTFSSCGDVPALTVTPIAAGSATISLSQASNSTDGTFDLAPATFTANVAPAPPADTTAPAWSCDPAAASAAWRNSEGSHSCTASDPSGLKAGSPASFTLSTNVGSNNENANASSTSQQLCDTLDNCTTAGAISGWKIDRKAPTISDNGATTLSNSNGWYKTDVTVGFAAADGGSGLASGVTSPFQRTTSGEGTAVSVASGSVADAVGNVNTGITSSGFRIDKTKPTVALVDGPEDGTSYYFGSVPAAPTCSASDALSDLAGPCSVSGYGSSVGNHTATASATDNAGNSDSASVSYTVLPWEVRGFYSPVDMNNVVNSVKGGSTVPLKFEVFAGSTEKTSTSDVRSFTQTKITCGASSVVDEIEVVSTGGTALRYDTTAGQFVQNWKTPTGAGCYRVTVTMQDGSAAIALFKTR